MQFNNLQELQNIIIKFSSLEIRNNQELTNAIKETHQKFLNIILKNILKEINVLQEDLTKNAHDPLLGETSQEKQEKLASLYSFQKKIESLQSEIKEMVPTALTIESEKIKINLLFDKIIDHLSQQEITNFKKIFEEDLNVAIKSLGFKIKTIQYRLKINPRNIYFAKANTSILNSIIPTKIKKMILPNKQKQGIEIADFDFCNLPSSDDVFKWVKPKQTPARKKQSPNLEELNEIDIANKLKITEEKQVTEQIEMDVLTTRQEKMQIAKNQNGKKLNEIKTEIKQAQEEIEMSEIKNNPTSR
ncbi:hypothetical protein [Spiroplasma sp. DGKH1]|uniref:hypothetical protein n=1 Tax=Spiroplasma sp. DGKH1 TaxID=3050074 RepID=UPI0034C64265